MRLFIELCGTSFRTHSILLPAHQNDMSKFNSALQTFKDELVNVDSFLNHVGNGDDDDGPFLFGTQFCLAECNMAPFVQRCCSVLPALTGSNNDENVPLVDPIEICNELHLQRLKSWIEAILNRPSVIKTGVSKNDMIASTSRMLDRIVAMQKEEEEAAKSA